MAKHAVPAGIFVQKSNTAESKHQTTTAAARAILDTETRQREAKTARLRELRLLQEAEAVPPAPKKVKAAPKAKTAPKAKAAAKPKATKAVASASGA